MGCGLKSLCPCRLSTLHFYSSLNFLKELLNTGKGGLMITDPWIIEKRILK
jgi:hypothetical protein